MWLWLLSHFSERVSVQRARRLQRQGFYRQYLAVSRSLRSEHPARVS